MALFEKFVDTIFLKEDSSLESELEALKNIKDKEVEKEKKEDILSNLDFLINIANDEYDAFFKRSQALDAKVGILVTIIGTLYVYAIDIDYLCKLCHNLTICNYNLLLLHIGMLIIFLTITILTFMIIIPKKSYFMPIAIFNDESYKKVDSITFKTIILLKSYKVVLEKNDNLLRGKNKKFTIICILSLIEIFIAIFLQMAKIWI